MAVRRLGGRLCFTSSLSGRLQSLARASRLRPGGRGVTIPGWIGAAATLGLGRLVITDAGVPEVFKFAGFASVVNG